jgi:hypothetical protein
MVALLDRVHHGDTGNTQKKRYGLYGSSDEGGGGV